MEGDTEKKRARKEAEREKMAGAQVEHTRRSGRARTKIRRKREQIRAEKKNEFEGKKKNRRVKRSKDNSSREMRGMKVLYLVMAMLSVVGAAIVGVDYGEEFTKAVLVAPGVPFEILLTSDSKRKDVSGVGFKKTISGDIERIYGSAALPHCIKAPKSCILHLKELLGRSLGGSETLDYLSIHNGVSLIASKNERKTVAVDVGDLGVYPVEEALAMSLGDIKQRAQSHLKSAMSSGYAINDVVITVPPFFDQAQRRALIDGAEVAGFNVIGLVDDGTAVAVNYASSRQFTNDKQYHIVYDMGEASTKATLFSVSSNLTTSGLIIEIEGIGYDTKLSGKTLTKSVFDLLSEKFLAQHTKIRSKDFNNSPRSMAKLWQAAEKAKTILSANNEASVSIESIYEDIDFRSAITREEFQEFNSDLMSKITKPILDIFESPLNSNLSITLEDVNSVILTGGSTRVPFVQKHLTILVGEDKIAKNVNADESAVLGATLRGVLLSSMFKAKDISVVDRSLNLYDAVIGSKSVPVFPRGSRLGESVTIELEGLTGTDFIVGLKENGELFKTHTFSDVKKSLSSLGESDTIKYLATFTLSDSRMFSLDKVIVKSEVEPIESVVDDEELSSSATATPVKAPKSKTITLSSKPGYPKQQPMSAYNKQSSISKLKELSAKDSARKRLDKLRNELESALYRLRSYLEDVAETGESAALVEEANELVTDHLEWLDYDSDTATSAVMKEKLQDVQVLHLKLMAYAEFLNKPLDGNEFTSLHKKALEAMHSIQDVMLTMAEDASSMKTNYTAIGLDWEAENAKIKISNLPLLEDRDIQDVFMSLNGDIETLIEKKLLQNDESTEDNTGEYSKEELFDIHQTIIEKINKLDEYKSLLEKAHTQRIGALRKVYRKNFMKKLREAQLAAAAEEAAKAGEEGLIEEEEKQDEDTDEVEGSLESPIVDNDETNDANEDQEPQDEVHDEL